MNHLLSLAAARQIIADKLRPLPPVSASLDDALGRVLAQAIKAREDLPGFDRSAMDGYALIARDPSEKFRIIAEIQPGNSRKLKVRRGECARIFTGAPVPAGATQVLMQELARVEGSFMIPLQRPDASHIRKRGEDARRGETLLAAGARLGPGELALLAGAGVTRVQVSPAVRVAHLATGNELVAPAQKPRAGQIRDSNSTLVSAFVRQSGGVMVKQERLGDDFKSLLKHGRALRQFDLLLVSGGASVGDYDFGQKLLNALGFEIHFSSINLRPGKPLVFGTRRKQSAFVLPGNPVSHWVTLRVAVRLALEQFTGAPPSWPMARMRLAEAFEHRPGNRETFCPAQISLQQGELVARALRWQSSGDTTGLAGVNALLQLDANAPAPKAGDDVSVLMLDVP